MKAQVAPLAEPATGSKFNLRGSLWDTGRVRGSPPSARTHILGFSMRGPHERTPINI